MDKTSAAKVKPVRQRAQYTCMAASLSMCLRALDVDVSEDEIADLMGVDSVTGGTWESTMAVSQYHGVRMALMSPVSIKTVKRSTDLGYPVMITWNPEGREWSHASVIFDVSDDLSEVHIADPNIPDPDQRIRIVKCDEFYKKWFEKWPRFLCRRVAAVFSREITEDGDQS